MSDKGKALYKELKEKLKELEDQDSPYFVHLSSLVVRYLTNGPGLPGNASQ